MFSPYARASAEIEGLTGKYAIDEVIANRHFGFSSTPSGYVWHHVENAKTMELIPKDLHDAVAHTGGAAILKKKVK